MCEGCRLCRIHDKYIDIIDYVETLKELICLVEDSIKLPYNGAAKHVLCAYDIISITNHIKLTPKPDDSTFIEYCVRYYYLASRLNRLKCCNSISGRYSSILKNVRDHENHILCVAPTSREFMEVFMKTYLTQISHPWNLSSIGILNRGENHHILGILAAIDHCGPARYAWVSPIGLL